MEIKTKFNIGDFVYVVVSKSFFFSESGNYVYPHLVSDLLIIRCCLTSVMTDSKLTTYTSNSFHWGRTTKCAEILEDCIFKTFEEAKRFAISQAETAAALTLDSLRRKKGADNSIEEDKL